MLKKYRMAAWAGGRDFPFNIGPTIVEGGFHEHTHDYVEMVVIRAGTGVNRIDGVAYECHPGDVFVFHRGMAHAFEGARQLSMVNLMFTPSLLRSVCRDVKALPGFQALFILGHRSGGEFRCRLQLDPPSLARAGLLLDAMQAEWEKKETGYQTALAGLLGQLVVLLSRPPRAGGEIPGIGEVCDRRLAEVAAHIEAHLPDPLPVAALARIACLSRRQFFRRFTAAYGSTPAQYILESRLQRAAELLRDPALNITEAAFRSGFTDSNYFTRAFGRRFRLGPREFRKVAG